MLEVVSKMYNLKVKNDKGETLNLTGNKDYIVYKIEGLNPPQATINSSVNTTSDGSKINSTRLENRNIVLYISIEGDPEKNRINLYKYFPIKKNITLYFSNNSRNVYIEGAVELIECDLFANKQVAQISIICPKPYFKNINTLTSYFSDCTSLFEFPFSISSEGIELSKITTNIRKTIINTGDVETGIVIELFSTGTVVNPIIYNTLTKKHMSFNFTMDPSDKLVINTNVGEKSVTLIRNGESINALGYMIKDSDWFVLNSGDNVFAYDCESGGGYLQISFSTSLLYSGV